MESINIFKKENIKDEMDFDEPMDTNETPFDDFYEEGEINSSDDEDKTSEKLRTTVPSIFTRKDQPAGFITRFNSFDKDEELRKLDRAKRFALPIKTTNVEDLQERLTNLHRDLGIDKENERHYRLNVIHMRGTENMSTEDVLDYFMSYAPSHIEWVNDVSCNVVWRDDISAARALLSISKKIKNLDKVHINADPFEKDFKEGIQMEDDEGIDENSVDARTIKTAIPPGFWRIGNPSNKSSFILLRYATRSDKKHQFAEKNSEYYKKYGNPNFNNMPGILSKSLRKEFRKSKYKNQDIDSIWKSNHTDAEMPLNGRKNPWAELAQEWGRSDKVEVEDFNYVQNRILKQDHSIGTDVHDLRISLQNKKRPRVSYSRSNPNSDNEIWESKSKIPKMKMYADDEEKKLDKNFERNYQGNRLHYKPVEDLRSKINRKKNKPRLKFQAEKETQESSNSDSNNSENEYEEGEYSDWALEQYHDLRESLDQNKRQERKKFSASKYYDSEQEEEEEEEEYSHMYKIDLGRRSPLQIEIDNDEYVGNKRN